MADAVDDNAPLPYVLAGRWLAFFRSLEEEPHPDSPAVNGAIDRVVETLPMHLSARMKMYQTLFFEELNPGPMPGIPAGGRQ
jgi:hypothetical protein